MALRTATWSNQAVYWFCYKNEVVYLVNYQQPVHNYTVPVVAILNVFQKGWCILPRLSEDEVVSSKFGDYPFHIFHHDGRNPKANHLVI